MKKDQPKPHQDWVPCEPGEIARLVNIQQAIDRRAAMSKISAGLVAAAAVGIGTTIYLTSGNDGLPANKIKTNNVVDINKKKMAPISCREVIARLPSYLDNSIADALLVARIDRHLGHCNYCCKKRDELKA